MARAFEAQVVGRLMGYGEEGEAKECGDGGGGKWSHARIQQLLEETKVGRA